MLCEDCADFVAGKCHSDDTSARERFGAAARDQWEVTECAHHRGQSARPDEEVLEDLRDHYHRMTRNMDFQALEDEYPEEHLARRVGEGARAWKGGPRHLPLDALEHCATLAEPTRELLIHLLTVCPELEEAKRRRYRITWRTGKWTAGGAMVGGQSKAIPQPHRERYGIAETWDLTLSLPLWCALDELERERLMHHELMHAATLQKAHPVQEFPETVARYGMMDREQARLAIAAVTHPEARGQCETWGLLASGQLTLWLDQAPEQIEVTP